MITVNIDKAKLISHNLRRIARSNEFLPLDRQIELKIPGIDVGAVESKRQAIRDKYATIQNEIDILTRLGDNGIEKRLS